MAHTSGRVRRGSLAVAAILLLATAVVLPRSRPATATGSIPLPIVVGYVPLPADDLITGFEAVNAAAGTTLAVKVGLTNTGSGAYIVYDHWEDGFEADLSNPAQSTTEVWGDGDGTNGDASTNCAQCTGDLVPQGAVFVLRNDVPTPRNPSTVLYDGGDKVASTRGFALTAAGWTTNLGSVLASAVSAYDRTKYGTAFVVPVGEDTPAPSGGTPAFEYTAASIMATYDDTVVSVDADGDGTDEATVQIDEGRTYYHPGGLLEGARITSSAPVQVHLVTGDVGSSYESRSYLLFPTELLTNDYVSPVGTTVANQPTAIYLHNPGAAALTVTPQCPSCSTTISLAAGETEAFLVPAGEAVRFSSPDGTSFSAVGAVGSFSGAVGAGGDQSTNFDWGFTLVPTRLLTTQVALGWAPGNSDEPPTDDDDGPVWVAAMADTDVRIDYDGDPATGALGPDSCYGRYDTELAITALTSNRLTDASDNDMTGARIYTCDGTRLAGAWGEDPANAPTGTPGLDAGYTLIPATTMLVDKSLSIGVDADGDGRIGPGDRIEYVVTVHNVGHLAFTDLTVTDPLGDGMTYVPGSTLVEVGSTVTPIADDAVPPAATPFPMDESPLALPDLAPGEVLLLAYSVTVDRPFPMGVVTLDNEVAISANDDTVYDRVSASLAMTDVELTVTETAGPTLAGQDATFLVTVGNDGPDTATDVTVDVPLPAGTGFVSATPSVGTYDDTTGTWTVGDLAGAASATLELVATVLDTSVEVFAEVSDAGGVDVDSRPAENPLGPSSAPDQDDEDTVTVTVAPRIDLSLTKVVTAGPDSDGEVTFTLTLRNDGPSTATGVTVTDRPAAGTTFVAFLASAGSFDFGAGTWTVPSLAPGATATLELTQVVTAFPSVHHAEVTAAGQTDVDSAPGENALGTGTPPAAPDQDDEAAATVTATASAAGIVWLDLDLDGTRDAGEPGLADVDVRVVAPGTDTDFDTSDDVVTTVTTTVGGAWSVTGLAPGTYRAAVSAPSLPLGALAATFDLDGVGTPHVAIFTLAPLQARTDVDFGTGGTSSLGGTVFDDADRDGTADGGEGLAGVAVSLRWAGPDGDLGTSDDVELAPATTGTGGSWSRTGLPSGSYRMEVDRADVPAALTIVAVDPDTTLDGVTEVTLGATASRTDLDVGFRRPPVDLGVSQTIDEPIEVGSTTTIRVTVTNNSADADGPIVVTNTLPAALGFVSATAPGFACSASGQVVTCTHPGPLPAGASTELTFVVTVRSAGSLENTVTVSVAGDVQPSDNQAVATVVARVPVTPTTTAPPVTAAPTSNLPRTGPAIALAAMQVALLAAAVGAVVLVATLRSRRLPSR